MTSLLILSLHKSLWCLTPIIYLQLKSFSASHDTRIKSKLLNMASKALYPKVFLLQLPIPHSAIPSYVQLPEWLWSSLPISVFLLLYGSFFTTTIFFHSLINATVVRLRHHVSYEAFLKVTLRLALCKREKKSEYFSYLINFTVRALLAS